MNQLPNYRILDAENWITTKNDGPLVERESRMSDTPLMLTAADRSTAAQNSTSTNHQNDNFMVGNLTSNAAPLSNSTPIVPQANGERHTEVTARANSSNKNQHSKNVANKALKRKHNNLGRFVLPPEYNPHSTRWTLRHRKKLKRLVELTPQSGIYVSYRELVYCVKVSKNCNQLARRLLPEVFNRDALSVCLSMTEKTQASHKVGSNVRPELDEHASSVLINFVLEYGRKFGWNTDLKLILSTLHHKVQEFRLKYGVNEYFSK